MIALATIINDQGIPVVIDTATQQVSVIGSIFTEAMFIGSAYWPYVTAVIAGASALSAILKKKEGFLGTIKDILDLLALNVVHAKNAKPVITEVVKP